MDLGAQYLAVIPAFLLVAGVFAVLMGVRRKFTFTNNHVACEQCGYDLFGLSASVPRCPECGHTTLSGGALPLRSCQFFIIRLFTGLLLVGIAFLTWRWVAAGSPDSMPYWLLVADTHSVSMSTTYRSTEELFLRWRMGKLSRSQSQVFVERLLDLEARPTVAWNPAWGQCINDARANNRISDLAWGQYWHQLAGVNFEVRRRIRRGEPIAVRVSMCNPTRLAGLYAQQVELKGLTLAGRQIAFVGRTFSDNPKGVFAGKRWDEEFVSA